VEIAREALVHLAPDASSLREGRQFVAETLEDWRVDEALIEPVLLVTNELVANAIVHAQSAPVLSLAAAGPDLLVKVADTSPAVPAPRPATTDETGGRGLILVEALADQWGFEPHSSGKVVWVTFEGAFG
jgi:anti-sigma regulatory factor (Ser/Thr protein kinase)